MMKSKISGIRCCCSLTSFFLLLYFICALENHAWGYDQGEITGVSPHNYDIDIREFNIKKNVKGEEVTKEWKLGGLYAVYVNCEKSSIPGRRRLTRVYSATTSMAASSINPNYLHLNDYLDVKVEIWIEGYRYEYVTAPFYNETNNMVESCTMPRTLSSNTESGSKGRVTFKITKPFINGISIDSYELVKLYGSLGTRTPLNNAITTVRIKSGIITVPDKCVVNAGQPITVDFGDIPGDSNRLNGNNFQQDVPIKVICKGGSFATGNLSIKLGVRPSGSGLAGFNSNYLGTTGIADRSNLGIVLKDKDSNALVVPGKFYDLKNFNNNTGSWNLKAAPVAKPGSEIPAGEFDASGSVVAEFQ